MNRPAAALVRQDRWAGFDGPEVTAPPPERATRTAGVVAWRTTAVRVTGGTLATTVVAVVHTLTPALTALLVVGLLWLVATSTIVLRHGWTQAATRVVSLADLLLVVAVIMASGGTGSNALLLLWLAPPAWVVLVDRQWYSLLVAAAPLLYLLTWLLDGAATDTATMDAVVVFLAMYAGSTLIGLVLLHLRIQANDHNETLQDARSALLRELTTAQQTEHERFSSRLHDGPLQLIISARQDLDDHRHETDGPRQFDRAVATLDDGIAGLRTMISELFPAESAGDVATQLAAICRRHEQRGAFTVDLQIDPLVGRTHDDLLVTLVSELVNNAAKHARATHLQITVADTGDNLTIEVADDGVGMDRRAHELAMADGHIGLTSLDRRVRTAGGSWNVYSAPGRGTVVRILLPSSNDAADPVAMP